MITIINTPSSMYEGMTIADAASQMVLEANNVIHEFEMDVLLSEHAYLYENACEVEYFVENKITDAGKNLVAKAQAAIEKVRKIIADLWNKLVDWVTTKVTEIKKKFVAVGIKKETVQGIQSANKEKVQEIVDAVANTENGWVLGVQNYTFEKGDLIEDPLNDDKAKKAGEFLAEIKETAQDNASVLGWENAIAYVYDSPKVLSNIKKDQHDADKVLNDMKKNAAKIFQKPDESELQQELINSIKVCLNSNTNVVRDKVKIYTMLVSNSIKVISAVAKIPAAQKKEAKAAKKNA